MNTLAVPSKTVSHTALDGRNDDPCSLAFSARAKYLPLAAFQLYLTGSLLAFAFGPLEWHVENPFALYSYAILGQILIGVGYLCGISGTPRDYSGGYSLRLLLKVSILLTLAFLPPTLDARNHAGLSVSEAVADPAAAYEAKLESDVSNPLLSIPRTLLSPILALFIPLGIVCWQEMALTWRVLWVLGACGRIALAFYTGRAFGIFDIMLVVPWMIWLSLHASRGASATARQPRQHRPNAIGRKIRSGIVAVAVVVLAFWYFNHSRYARFGNDYPIGTTGWSEDLYGVAIPESAEFGIYYVTRYWTLGYYGLSGCLELPFEWTYGIGHSTFLNRYAGMMNDDLREVEYTTYPARLEAETGYSRTQFWHTIYPWLASDVTFFGALLFMGLMGFLLARAWSDSLLRANPFAIGFLGQIMLLFYYIPANNLRMANPEASFAFWGLLMMWTLTRKKLPPHAGRI